MNGDGTLAKLDVCLGQIVVIVCLIFFLSIGQSDCHYVVNSDAESDSICNDSLGAGSVEAAGDYYLYNSLEGVNGKGSTAAIFASYCENLLAYDRIDINKPISFDNNTVHSAPNGGGSAFYADMELQKTYEEHRRLQIRSRELLTGLSVPYQSDAARGSNTENPIQAPQLMRKSAIIEPGGLKSNPKNSGRGTDTEMGKVEGEAIILSSSGRSRGYASGIGGNNQLDDDKPSEYPQPENIGSQRELGAGKKDAINSNRDDVAKDSNLKWVLVVFIAMQKFLLTNPRVIIIILLLIALVFSLFYSSLRRG